MVEDRRRQLCVLTVDFLLQKATPTLVFSQSRGVRDELKKNFARQVFMALKSFIRRRQVELICYLRHCLVVLCFARGA